MLSDIDKLRHGPAFELCEIDVFDRRRERPQYMVMRNIIEVVRDLIGNPALKDETMYAPERVWTSPSKRECAFGDANACEWWWNKQVSNDTRVNDIRMN